jgi:transposase
MPFVPVKTQAQQTILSLHRARAGLVRSRTAPANQIRRLLGEFGIVLPQDIPLLGQRAIAALSSRDSEPCEPFRALIQMLVEHLHELGNRVTELEGRIRAIHRTDAPGQLLETIPGIGPLTASALAASIDNARAFRSGRELAAWPGLVPRQHSSGGTPHLLGISKRGGKKEDQAPRGRSRNRRDFGWKRWSRCWLYEELKLFNGYRVRRAAAPKARPA